MIFKTKKIGLSNLLVSPIGFGVYPLSDHNRTKQKPRPDETAAIDMIAYVLSTGINFIDTANVYCIDQNDLGYGERLVRKALEASSQVLSITVATKGIARRDGGLWSFDGSPAHMRKSCEQSLRDLGVETIDLYQTHGVDEKIPLVETVGELFRMQKEGKIRHIGLSNVNKDQLKVVLKEGRVESVQNCLNPLFKRDLSNGLVNFCEQESISFIAYSPLGGELFHDGINENPVLQSIAHKHDASTYQVALAWSLSLTDHIIPIPAATKKASWQDTLESLSLKLDEDDKKRILTIEDKVHPYA